MGNTARLQDSSGSSGIRRVSMTVGLGERRGGATQPDLRTRLAPVEYAGLVKLATVAISKEHQLI